VPPDNQRGVALLEAIVALAILMASGVGAIGLLAAASRSEYRLRRLELVQANADRVLTASSLLSRRDLDLRLGERVVGEFIVEVERPETALYRLSVREQASRTELLATVVYRPEPMR
jgi:type II secretory pathway pseudopilin PulG